MTSDAVETAAQLIHQLHRAGTANVCGECREVARQVAEVLDVERLRQIEQRAHIAGTPIAKATDHQRGCIDGARYILTGEDR